VGVPAKDLRDDRAGPVDLLGKVSAGDQIDPQPDDRHVAGRYRV
jgi:hypothetical protein